MDDADTRLRRVRAQRLAPRGQRRREVVRARVRDPGAGRAARRGCPCGRAARASTAADVDGAGLVRTWAWRGTLHLLVPEDVPWVLLAARPVAGDGPLAAARARRGGLRAGPRGDPRRAAGDPRRAARAARRRRRGPAPPPPRRPAAREGLLELRLDDTYAALDLPPLPPREEALEELGRRYAAAFGPSTAKDLPSGPVSAARPTARRRRSGAAGRAPARRLRHLPARLRGPGRLRRARAREARVPRRRVDPPGGAGRRPRRGDLVARRRRRSSWRPSSRSPTCRPRSPTSSAS